MYAFTEITFYKLFKRKIFKSSTAREAFDVCYFVNNIKLTFTPCESF